MKMRISALAGALSAGIAAAPLWADTTDVKTQSRVMVSKTGAHCVANGNPGCSVQIEAGVRAKHADLEVAHPMTLLARAYRGKKK